MENVRTINGKPLKQVMAELSAEFPATEVSSTNYDYSYIDIERMRNRMDEVVGVENYDFVINASHFVPVGDKIESCCVATITIRDDNGCAVCSKSGIGGTNVKESTENGTVIKASLDAKSAVSDAFKSCCRQLGIGDRQLRSDRKEKNKSKNKKSGSASYKSKDQYQQNGKAQSDSSSEERMQIVLQGGFYSFKSGYKAKGVVKSTGESVVLVLWNDNVVELEKYIELSRFLRESKNMELSIIGKRDTFKGENQVHLLRPYCGKEAS